MATPTPPGPTVDAVEGALLSVVATEGAYIVAGRMNAIPLDPLLALGLGLVAFAGYLGYKVYKAGP